MAGGICMNYTNYQQKHVIGYGGFGKVYQLNKDYAVKEEYKVTKNEIWPFCLLLFCFDSVH